MYPFNNYSSSKFNASTVFHLDAENYTQQFRISLSVSDTVVTTGAAEHPKEKYISEILEPEGQMLVRCQHQLQSMHCSHVQCVAKRNNSHSSVMHVGMCQQACAHHKQLS